MAKRKRTSLIPLTPVNYKGELKPHERDCVAWQVLSGCTYAEAFVLFIHPELVGSAPLATRLANEFFGSKEVAEFTKAYTEVVRSLGNPVGSKSDAAAPKATTEPRKDGESEDEFKRRRKRAAAESIVEKIIERVDDVEDIDDLLDTIKAMEKTNFFDDDSVDERPPVRYLPVTCSECEYKKFIDEQVKQGNITKS